MGAMDENEMGNREQMTEGETPPGIAPVMTVCSWRPTPPHSCEGSWCAGILIPWKPPSCFIIGQSRAG